MQTKQCHQQSGFTLIELMIVVAIIGVLATVAIPAYSNYVKKSEAASALATLKALITPAELFYQENGTASAAALTNLGTASDINNLGTLVSELASSGSAPTLKFTFGSNSTMTSSEIITYSRDNDTGWICSATSSVPTLTGC
ncbi:type IV pilin PilA [Vibrio orientalis CIP 102891 = ATCC 33934]|uniref:Type IV pilin PilA n=1 Tax=Vibrio orientalis CIP 102891 = ATCC 33934 TaxID=675816 RepID=C9QCK4_VIBOR|nr:prepilin-type N-terminal cleavage/methylation domain-containing protein [Vibrio orientalis]EEX95345.1 type IV pilin PilA [Vibrio orientalis CIP 102891 = ATCC 33934]EGU52384.1 type IV pilin PilA [Vibrio orientalis CIP 102891 = ATCC 33934]